MHALTTASTTVSTRLETDLTPASEREIMRELELLFLAFGSDAERVGAKRTVLYIDACRGEPLWAVQKGIRDVRNGLDDGKTTDFLPSTMRLARAVRKESEWARERASRHRKDDPEPPPPTALQRMNADQFKAHLSKRIKSAQTITDGRPDPASVYGPSPAGKVAAETEARRAAKEIN